jgi:hypothetical protein
MRISAELEKDAVTACAICRIGRYFERECNTEYEMARQSLSEDGPNRSSLKKTALVVKSDVRPPTAPRKLTLEYLVSRITDANRHAETEWGPGE